jgi:HEAT repeat protein
MERRYDPGVARISSWLWVGSLVLVGGCTPIPKGFDSPEPAARIEAAVDAADRGDRSAIPQLIGLLDSDDPATRLVAIRALERLTGQTLGYDHAGPEADRAAAVARWEDWQRGSNDVQALPAEATHPGDG